MSAFVVTVRQLGRPSSKFLVIGSSSSAAGEFIASRYSEEDAPAISVYLLNRSRK